MTLYYSRSSRATLVPRNKATVLYAASPKAHDTLAAGREVILFDNAGIGRSTGLCPARIEGMATHALAFLDGLGVTTCDVLGFLLGGMIAQQIAGERPSLVRQMILVGTAPRGGHDIMLWRRGIASNAGG